MIPGTKEARTACICVFILYILYLGSSSLRFFRTLIDINNNKQNKQTNKTNDKRFRVRNLEKIFQVILNSDQIY